MADIEFDLMRNTEIWSDILANLKINLVKKFSDFRIQEIFRIRENTELRDRSEQFYVDVNDNAALCEALEMIYCRMCSLIFDPVVQNERPNYLNRVWMIAFAYEFSIDLMNPGKSTLEKPRASQSTFTKNFKNITFEKIEPLTKDHFKENIEQMESFITNALSRMDFIKAVSCQSTLFQRCITVQDDLNLIAHTDSQELDIQKVMDGLVGVLCHFYNVLIEAYFEGFKMHWCVKSLISMSYRNLWKKLVGEEAPDFLEDFLLFGRSKEDISISLRGSEKENHLFGAEIKDSSLSYQLNESEKFKGLSQLFTEMSPYMMMNRHSSYFITNFEMTLYFELPVEDSWKSVSENEVMLVDAPLKYMIVDQSKNNNDGSLNLLTMISMKVYDRIKKLGANNLGMSDCQESHHGDMDRVANSEGYSTFMKKFLKEGLRMNSINSNQVNHDLDKDKCKNSELDKRTELGPLFPTDVRIRSSHDLKYVEECSHLASLKLIFAIEDIQRNVCLRYRINPDVNEQVFLKIFEIYWLESLYITAKEGDAEYLAEHGILLNDVDNETMLSIEDNDIKRFEYLSETVREQYLREIIAYKRIESWNKHHPKHKINAPKLLQYGWIVLDTPGPRVYGGPYIILENLKFINRNKIEGNPERERSYKRQQRLLLKAGIEHQDLKPANVCFNDQNKCYIVDFGVSVVDDDRIFKKYDIYDLVAPLSVFDSLDSLMATI